MILTNFDKKTAKEFYTIMLGFLANFTRCVTEDYLLTDTLTNYEFLNKYLSKTQIKRLRGDIVNAVKYLVSLSRVNSSPSASVLCRWKRKFDSWQRQITQIHIDQFASKAPSENLEWFYLGLALHFLLDIFFHIFAKLENSSQTSLESCFWCDEDLTQSWRVVMLNILTKQIPHFYTHLSLAQNQTEDVNDIFSNFLVLVGAIMELHTDSLRIFCDKRKKVTRNVVSV